MKNKELNKQLLDFDLEKGIVVAQGSMRVEIRPCDIKEENNNITI